MHAKQLTSVVDHPLFTIQITKHSKYTNSQTHITIKLSPTFNNRRLFSRNGPTKYYPSCTADTIVIIIYIGN